MQDKSAKPAFLGKKGLLQGGLQMMAAQPVLTQWLSVALKGGKERQLGRKGEVGGYQSWVQAWHSG